MRSKVNFFFFVQCSGTAESSIVWVTQDGRNIAKKLEPCTSQNETRTRNARQTVLSSSIAYWQCYGFVQSMQQRQSVKTYLGNILKFQLKRWIISHASYLQTNNIRLGTTEITSFILVATVRYIIFWSNRTLKDNPKYTHKENNKKNNLHPSK